MNRRGNPETLVAAQPGNLNAVKRGVHSPRLIQACAAELEGELTRSFEFSPTQRLAVHEVARCMAILEAIDRDLDERELEDETGKPRYCSTTAGASRANFPAPVPHDGAPSLPHAFNRSARPRSAPPNRDIATPATTTLSTPTDAKQKGRFACSRDADADCGTRFT